MNQTEIDELRERIDAAISTVCNGMAAMSIPADPRDVDLVLADCAKALAALEEARAERDKANLRERNIFASLRMALGEDLGGGGGLVEILNGIEGLQDQRDAAESLAWDALGRPGGTHDKTNVQRLCEAHGALKAKLAALATACSTWQEWGGHCDTCEFVRQRAANPILDTALFADYCDCGWHATREALAAAKVQP